MPKIVGAVQASAAILRVLAGSPPLRLVDIVALTGLNSSTALNILHTLCVEGLVRHDVPRRRYEIGEGLLKLGASAASDRRSAQVAAIMDELARSLGLSVLLWRMAGADDAELVAASAPANVNLSFPLLRRAPLLQGAVGRIFAIEAGLTAEELAAIYPTLGWANPPGLDAWLAQIADARRTGYACDRGNNNSGLFGMAVRVGGSGPSGHALAIAALGSISDAEVGGLVPRVSRAARMIAPFL
ncbi:IclR family transcriptional regulator [Sphingomonas sp.]|uniref:IclR family transcriptional regulator n=1 Tax=Sphingomonas sp. TaxID=28214 RepID=UPI002DD6B485|nr:helix-turn-helix domain-containing protein [Sphingomonas sp.]